MRVIILFTCLVISINSFSQKVTYKDFIGLWDNSDTSSALFEFKFDSTAIIFKNNKNLNYWDTLCSRYSLITKFNLTVLHCPKCAKCKWGKPLYIILKIFNNDTLKMQWYSKRKKVKWDIENEHSTFILANRH
jgi:hypothetical protein